MEYKLNLITPSVYSPSGPKNCVDPIADDFANYLQHRADNEFKTPCKYVNTPGLAVIHSFLDFEKQFLIHSEYAVIIVSPNSKDAIKRFLPRLLVFLTDKGIWQNRFLFALIGDIEVTDSLVIHPPIRFSLNDWRTHDESSWQELFGLIKVKWIPYVEETIEEKREMSEPPKISSVNENVVKFTDVATQGSSVIPGSFYFINKDEQQTKIQKSFQDDSSNTYIEDTEGSTYSVERKFEDEEHLKNVRNALNTDNKKEDYRDESIPDIRSEELETKLKVSKIDDDGFLSRSTEDDANVTCDESDYGIKNERNKLIDETKKNDGKFEKVDPMKYTEHSERSLEKNHDQKVASSREEMGIINTDQVQDDTERRKKENNVKDIKLFVERNENALESSGKNGDRTYKEEEHYGNVISSTKENERTDGCSLEHSDSIITSTILEDEKVYSTIEIEKEQFDPNLVSSLEGNETVDGMMLSDSNKDTVSILLKNENADGSFGRKDDKKYKEEEYHGNAILSTKKNENADGSLGRKDDKVYKEEEHHGNAILSTKENENADGSLGRKDDKAYKEEEYHVNAILSTKENEMADGSLGRKDDKAFKEEEYHGNAISSTKENEKTDGSLLEYENKSLSTSTLEHEKVNSGIEQNDNIEIEEEQFDQNLVSSLEGNETVDIILPSDSDLINDEQSSDKDIVSSLLENERADGSLLEHENNSISSSTLEHEKENIGIEKDDDIEIEEDQFDQNMTPSLEDNETVDEMMSPDSKKDIDSLLLENKMIDLRKEDENSDKRIVSLLDGNVESGKINGKGSDKIIEKMKDFEVSILSSERNKTVDNHGDEDHGNTYSDNKRDNNEIIVSIDGNLNIDTANQLGSRLLFGVNENDSKAIQKQEVSRDSVESSGHYSEDKLRRSVNDKAQTDVNKRYDIDHFQGKELQHNKDMANKDIDQSGDLRFDHKSEAMDTPEVHSGVNTDNTENKGKVKLHDLKKDTSQSVIRSEDDKYKHNMLFEADAEGVDSNTDTQASPSQSGLTTGSSVKAQIGKEKDVFAFNESLNSSNKTTDTNVKTRDNTIKSESSTHKEQMSENQGSRDSYNDRSALEGNDHINDIADIKSARRNFKVSTRGMQRSPLTSPTGLPQIINDGLIFNMNTGSNILYRGNENADSYNNEYDNDDERWYVIIRARFNSMRTWLVSLYPFSPSLRSGYDPDRTVTDTEDELMTAVSIKYRLIKWSNHPIGVFGIFVIATALSPYVADLVRHGALYPWQIIGTINTYSSAMIHYDDVARPYALPIEALSYENTEVFQAPQSPIYIRKSNMFAGFYAGRKE